MSANLSANSDYARFNTAPASEFLFTQKLLIISALVTIPIKISLSSITGMKFWVNAWLTKSPTVEVS